MGYDMYYRFDPIKKYDKGELLDRLADAGAEVVERADGTRDVFFGRLGIWFHDSPESIAKGDWLWSRMPPREEWFIHIFRFADKLGCTLFDPQTERMITPLDVKEALANREAAQRRIGALLGRVVDPSDESKDN